MPQFPLMGRLCREGMFRVRGQKICKAVGNHRRCLSGREKALFLLPLDLSRRVLRGWNETL